MKTVKFVQQWRGHEKDKVTDLTEERASELIRCGVCVVHVPSVAAVDVPRVATPEVVEEIKRPPPARRRRPRQAPE
jgi:hypothetical protein